jgi:hypothetical protein
MTIYDAGTAKSLKARVLSPELKPKNHELTTSQIKTCIT